MTTQTIRPEALKMLAAISFDPWRLMGPSQRLTRQHLMMLLTGLKPPVAKCGVTAIQAELERQFPHQDAASCAARYPVALENALGVRSAKKQAREASHQL